MTEQPASSTQPPEPVPPSPPWVRKAFLSLLAVLGFIVALDFVINYMQAIDDETIQDMFNVAREESFGNWYSSTITAAVAGSLWFIWLRMRGRSGGKSVRGWAVLAFFFFYVSIDDGMRFHEETAGAIQDYLVGATEEGEIPTGALGPIGRLLEANPSYPWLILYGPIIGAFGLYMLWFLWKHLDRRSAKRVALAIGCFAVAECQDFIEGIDGSYDRITERFNLDAYTAPHFGKVFEETFESIGMTILFCIFLEIGSRLYLRGCTDPAEIPPVAPEPPPKQAALIEESAD